MRNEIIRNNNVCLEIESFLRERYVELSGQVGLYSNIIGVFYHELMVYLTNYYLIKNSEASAGSSGVSAPKPNNLTRHILPSCTTENCEPRRFEKSHHDRKRPWQILIEIIFALKKGKARIGFDNYFISHDLKNILPALLGKYQICFETNNSLWLDNKDYQTEYLRKTIKEAAHYIRAPRIKEFAEDFVRFALSHVSDDQQSVNNAIFINVSNAHLQSRIRSANYKAKDKPVISFAHSCLSAYVTDEPLMGYGELSYCDYYVTYGHDQNFYSLKYARPLQRMPQIIYRSDHFIQKYYRTPEICFRELNSQVRILYAPTTFCGNMRYGPFRDIADNLYEKWQYALLRCGLDVTYKPHPSNRGPVKIRYAKTMTGNLMDCMHDFDFYFLDYISTASGLLGATDKCIIYFNLGLRNMSKDVLEDFKKRVFWVDIDLFGDLDKQISDAIANYNDHKQNFYNSYTEKYSLCKEETPDSDMLKRIIEDTVHN